MGELCMDKSSECRGIDSRIKKQIEQSPLAAMSKKDQLLNYKESVKHMRQNGTSFTKTEFKAALKEIR
jgi:hypothetical protein